MPTSSSSIPSTRRTRRRSTGGSTSCATSAPTDPAGARRLPLAALLACAIAACHGTPADPVDAAPSPQANAEPAPLANVPAAASAAAPPTLALDGGAFPMALRGDRELPPDAPHETAREVASKDAPREPRDPRELSGYELQVVLHAGEGPPAPKAAEVNVAAIDAARHKTEARMVVDASQSRARFVLSGGFVLPAGAELRARVDRYGHLLLLPDEGTYRVVEPGALRALLGERRLDVAPVSPVQLTAAGEGTRRLNQRTRRIELATRAAKATFEIASMRDAGEGGTLVCRMLLDLMGAPPGASLCAVDDVPLHAELRWTTQGALAFDVVSIVPRRDLSPQDLAAPPSSSAFVTGAPAPASGEPMLSRSELAAFRTAPVDVPATRAPDAQAPEAGLVLANATDALRIAWIDGVAAAWVGPGGSLALPSLVRGRYTLQWRTFLGDAADPPQQVVVPGRAELGGADLVR